MSRTLFDKIWDAHVAGELDDGTSLVHLDRVFVHERTGSVALKALRERGLRIHNPNHVFAAMDHIVDTLPGRDDTTLVPGGEAFIRTMRDESARAGLTLFDMDDPNHGITHVVSAEQGITMPGLIVACPDSHTCTLGALGAIGWGIGTSDCEHALATGTLRATKPGQIRVRFEGNLAPGVTAKDMILHLIRSHTASGGLGHVVEFAGPAVDALDIEARFTLCNMAVEFSAFTGIVAPDKKTIEYVSGRSYAPTGDAWNDCVAYWASLHSDLVARFDKEIVIDCASIAPTITWGTSPEHAVAVNAEVPSPDDAHNEEARKQLRDAMQYMGVKPGESLVGMPIQGAFIGSCTNARISDLRAAAAILDGNKVAKGVRAICTPGSRPTKLAAEAEGLDQVFLAAGFEWREPGCSLCFNAGGESFGPEERVVTSTNRNFRGRQGHRTRSHLASPASVAASAIAGCIADVRELAPR